MPLRHRWPIGVPMRLFDFFKRTERRRHKRIRVVKTGWIRTSNSALSHVCVIWDISEGGARIAFASHIQPDGPVELFLDRTQTLPTVCRVRWTRPGELGLEFVANPQPILDLLAASKKTGAVIGV